MSYMVKKIIWILILSSFIFITIRIVLLLIKRKRNYKAFVLLLNDFDRKNLNKQTVDLIFTHLHKFAFEHLTEIDFLESFLLYARKTRKHNIKSIDSIITPIIKQLKEESIHTPTKKTHKHLFGDIIISAQLIVGIISLFASDDSFNISHPNSKDKIAEKTNMSKDTIYISNTKNYQNKTKKTIFENIEPGLSLNAYPIKYDSIHMRDYIYIVPEYDNNITYSDDDFNPYPIIYIPDSNKVYTQKEYERLNKDK